MKILGTQDFITHVEELLDPDLCTEIIAEFSRSPDVAAGKVLNTDTGHCQNSDKISFDLQILPEGNWKNIYARVHAAVSTVLQEYVPALPSLQVYPLEGTGYKMQMYPKQQGKFAWHFDALSHAAQRRLVAMIIYLNDVDKGGETEFHYQQIKVSPKTGYSVLFPTAWTHLHCGLVPESNDKYIISTFLQYKMD